jgi:hypothetical protein
MPVRLRRPGRRASLEAARPPAAAVHGSPATRASHGPRAARAPRHTGRQWPSRTLAYSTSDSDQDHPSHLLAAFKLVLPFQVSRLAAAAIHMNLNQV